MLLRILLFVALMPAALLPVAPHAAAQSDEGFRFIRVRYEDPRGEGRGFRRGGGAWSHDYPTAEHNLHMALERTTGIRVAGEPLILSLSDKRIFEYPFLYLCEPGYWSMNEEEAGNLREYLNRGGFIMFDDFGNENELMQLVLQMEKVFPDQQPQEIPNDHPIWSIFFDIDPVAAPSLVGGRGYFTDTDDTYLAYFDDKGRMVALVCYNQDLGDGWEWPERSLADASTISFQMGINFIIYAMTH
ncbi:MAG: DUF4159 domain-containing protein [Rhodothermales bacterium]